MGKIKLNLVSGAVVEKPLINAFKANGNSYVVLDNELNGSMGLPIILVCKSVENKLTKILDQGEWQIVKEYLKNIIAGNQIEFINIDNEMVADDIYYTQLTLPVPSFDALKNAYKIEDNNIGADIILATNPEPVMNAEPVVPFNDTVVPVAPEVVTPAVDGPSVSIADIPVVDIPKVEEPVVSPSIPGEPVIDVNIPMPSAIDITPSNDINLQMPTADNISFEVANPTTIVNDNPSTVISEVSVFKEQKEAFMQACENMFDALVQKFEKELENRK